MNSTLLAVLVVLVGSSLVMSASLQAAGFRPGKVYHPSAHARAALTPTHHRLMDLEEDAKPLKNSKKAVAKTESSEQGSLEENQDKQVKELLQKASSHLQQLEADFKTVKADMNALKTSEEARLKKADEPAEAEKPQTNSDEVVDDFAASDNDNTASFIQFDDMNNGVEDDDSPVPLVQRMRTNFIAKGNDADGIAFGMTGDGSSRTYDIDSDGNTIVNPEVETMLPPTNSNEVKDQNSTATPDMEKDVVCVCKRRGAPRGEDRVRCKKHITPTPTPTPTPTAIKGVRQCVNGTWQPNSGADSGVNDVICIYWPSQMPLLQVNPTPTPAPNGETGTVSEPEYPPECYDERNEFVADGVIEKRKFDSVLLQQGFETCGC